MQHEITTRHALLNEQGRLIEPGYSKGLLMDYDRKAIKGGALRIKEWDYYLIANNDYAVALTIADNSYMGLDGISLLDFRKPWEHTNNAMSFLTLGKRHFPASSSNGDVSNVTKKYSITFKHNGDHRILSFHMDNFMDGKPISGEIRLENPDQESMVIITPFAEKDTAFYYNQKINCMPASGQVEFDGEVYRFEKENSFGVLDWGRGVWTYDNVWYWGSASGLVDGVPFGFNIGYGFGDTSAASENMLFYGGRAHKLSQVTFNIPKKNRDYTTRGGCCGSSGVKVSTQDFEEDYMSPWTFTSDDGRFEMDFVPIIDRASCTDVKLICSDQHQVFGRFTGKAVLDDGKEIFVKDFLGFAERVHNKW